VALGLHGLSMEKGFLTAKGRGSGKGVKEKHNYVVGVHARKVMVRNSSPTGIASSPSVSFATLVKGDTSRKSVNFRSLITPPGKRVAYPVVDNYIKNTWSKFGLVKSMMINDMFFFKFRSKDGMKSMLKNDSWLIRNVPLILKKWTPYVNIIKEDVCNISVGVKFHDIPIIVFTEDGLSVIATKLGNPLMLDSYTVAMCTNYWGRASYARAMVELQADVELKDTIVVVVPKFIGAGYNMRTIHMHESLHTQEAEQVEGNGKKDINTSVPSNLYYTPPIGVVSSVHGSLHVVCGSLNATPLARIINKLERQMLDGKLTLVDDHGKLLNKVDSDPVNSDSESDVEVAYDETVQLMASGGANDAILYEDEDYDIYDTYDIEGLTKQELTFYNMMYINLRKHSGT
ncbi:reverse transcriptase domain-containing protein, partial [Tanacetum coccineum]